ncbi:anti-Muellerian hormone type-2 receptor isoform X2 [Sceloporus undulatus]|uniref:anti-Muellerian hormone type-2 receptor isoform X2 n=1 Tax=Sceloporus undulatus TaxID=8520 RepID=UPI001C4DCB3D|nr:anti-Muellerian hormone type-2 receptor isoform X2 [Sceloporus undulatus]
MENRSCISYGSDAVTEGLELLQGLILNDGRNGTIQCPHNQCCFGIWNLTHGQPQVKVQGCWMGDENICDSPTCEPRSAGGFLSCRCRSNLCNAHIIYAGPGKRQAESWPGPSGTFWIIAAGLALLFLGCLVFVVQRYWKVPAVLLCTEATVELTKVNATGPEHKAKRKLPEQKFQDLQFLQVLHDGQFSRLWQGTFHQQPVAIKAFSPLCCQQFASEWAVHSLPLMSHDNVVQLLAAGYGGPNEEQGGLLVLTLYPLGSLRNFLSQHVCSWDITIQLGSSLARGLAFLHGQQWKEGLHKPGVAHRDLSSQNVLVREDKTCVITDFGHAMTLPVCHEQFKDGSADICKAGAPRYIAPEILDESLNLQDLGSALRQADVYSLALVLWEILMRCSALFPENNVPEFQLPYEAELGRNPTHSELWMLAVKERGRPAIPLAWKRMGQVAVCLEEILEDCWDPEPEARLQAECAQQRLQRLDAADLPED